MYSVFGEYQKELLDMYHIFGMDAGYETGSYSEPAVIGRLRYYGAENMELDITDLQLLTDNQGAAFYDQVLYYMETRYGLGLVQEFTGLTGDWEEQMIQGESYYEQKEEKIENLTVPELPDSGSSQQSGQSADAPGRADGQGTAEMEEGLQNEEEARAARDSLTALKNQDDSWLLQKVLPVEFEVSEFAVIQEEMPSVRALKCGYGSFQQRDLSGAAKKLLFEEYLLQTFSNALDQKETSGLSYEIEYVIGGKASDRENLESTVRRLVLLRFAADYTYLLTDEIRKAEAGTAALTICTLLMVPQMAEAVKQAMLLIWAYREGILDVKYLLSGRRIPLAKTYDTWRLPLGGIMGSGNAVVTEAGLTDEEDGLNYEEYLRILLFLTDCGECSMRSLDMIEVGLKERKNLEFFHIDHCITRMKVKSIAELRSGITYDFSTEFFYR